MQCGIQIPSNSDGTETHKCHKDAIRQCEDCGIQLCRDHKEFCIACDLYLCEYCMEGHQLNTEHLVRAELVEVSVGL